MAKRKRSTKACHATTVRFKTKRGKTISFKGHQGANCGPRPKPKTGHLRAYKQVFKQAAKFCKGKPRGQFLNCMASHAGR